MPLVYAPVQSTENSFHRPSIFAIISQLKEQLGIDKEVRIVYPDKDGIDIQTGSAINSSAEAIFPAEEKIFIEVDESTNRENLLSNPHYQPGNRFVFRDEALQVYLKTTYIKRDLTIAFKYRLSDRVRAERLRDDIEARMTMIREMFLHTIEYGYQIPAQLLERLKAIHELRENIAGYGDSFQRWLIDHSVREFTQVTNTGGKDHYYTFAERAVRLVGWFDFEAVPEKTEREGPMTPHILTFNYRLMWNAPTGMVMGHPVMVHNQILPRKFLYLQKVQSPEQERLITASFPDVALSYFERKHGDVPYIPQTGITIPSQDEWRATTFPPGTLRCYSSLIMLDPTDLTFINRIDDLGSKYYIPDVLLNFLIGESPYLAQPGKSVFLMSLYDDCTPIHPDDVYVTDELEFRSVQPLNLRRVYHVRFSVYCDFTLIDQAARDRLRDHPEIMEILLPAITTEPPTYEVSDGGITRPVMDEITAVLLKQRHGRKIRGMSVPKTVMFSMIRVGRKPNA